MLETAISFVETLPLWGILLFAFAITFVENIFPPSPSDVILVFLGTFVGIDKVGFLPLLFASTLGSTLGFLLMFYLGSTFSERIIESNKFSFISREMVHKVEAMVRKNGNWLILGNRFLSGTRAIISFVAGMSELPLLATTLLCILGSVLWNVILISSGWALGSNWRIVEEYLALYGQIFLVITALAIGVWAVWYVRKNGMPTFDKKDTL